MTLAIIAIIAGLVLLVWSADRFVEGSASAAKHFGMSPLLIGMLVVGFGTSAPEIVVSVLSSFQGNSGIALGNAYGSNIANIAFILGLTALINPVSVRSSILRSELPVLVGVTAIAAAQLLDGTISRLDSLVLLAVFAGFVLWSIRQSRRTTGDPLGSEIEEEQKSKPTMSLKKALAWLSIGLLLLIASSRLLVWGAVEIAQGLGVSDLVIGLTIVAVGTSLPELASSIIAARKGEHDIAFGNVLGSNLFNTLAVVGVAGLVNPIAASPEVLHRDVLTMGLLTFALFALGHGFGRQGRINRFEGGILIVSYAAYLGVLLAQQL
ncbi:calcium/sodium antiporter [Pelagicoccus sp. SDUM812003]|uniref:calcium/sodium antiporter n=1 Tax=Pelagicoccus sp. SDUM812003 TaxID=3041267 RepID=UPI00280F126B|nr:calcium/sodium antiporter [Pelagicoccus sp. SDUM812003]MDQ8205589.1 calcium/sodium antiporter [Pelagicoccus sp. SDUM812003]